MSALATGGRAIAGLPTFELPAELEAKEPPEARGLTRDAVRMMVAFKDDGTVVHSHFAELPRFLRERDVLVINTSGTLAAEIDGIDAAGAEIQLHLSSRLPAGLWTVELRRGKKPVFDALPGSSLELTGGARAVLLAPYASIPAGVRLWVASIDTPQPLLRHLSRYGRPISYGYLRSHFPLSSYQNVYVTEPGSAEMPSAGRPFTPEVITRLVAQGVDVVPLVLHTGVASLEASEPPYPEYYRVSPASANRINDARRDGGTVVAVGTTVVRALETVVDERGAVHPGSGWTETVVTPDREVRSVDGLLTGWHEPEASHLAMLEAIAGRPLLERCYDAALSEGYLWHEFGDVHLVLP